VLSATEARRIALAAQGFAQSRPATPPTRRALARVFDRIALAQIDSVNVLVRAHYLPLFSRLGSYPPELLDEAAYGSARRRTLFEYWGHEASLLPLRLHPLLRWRMERARHGEGCYRRIAEIARARPRFVEEIFDTIAQRGAATASSFEDGKGRGAWWGWSDVKIALEYLFWCGRVTTARRKGFERVYDLPERVLPRAVIAAPTPTEPDAQRELVRIAARALGIATEADLRDYFRLDTADAKLRIAELVEADELVPVRVERWSAQAYLDPGARLPRRVEACALLSPFDSLVWHRSRAERLFGFRYRLEIYTPAHKREHGYYVLPFLLGERLAARIDLKADRGAMVLRVPAAYAEPEIPAADVAAPLETELTLVARWLGLARIEIGGRGDLSKALRAL
jgi:uncharacterized protein